MRIVQKVGVSAVVYDEEMARLFVRDGTKVADKLESIQGKMDNPTDDDLKMYASSVHAIKSVLSHVSESALQATAITLEQAARLKDLSIISTKTDKFIMDLRAVIERVMPDEEDIYADLSADERAFLSDNWFAVYTECIVKSKEKAMDTLKLIKEKPWSSEIVESIDTASDLISEGNFERAAEIAERESSRLL